MRPWAPDSGGRAGHGRSRNGHGRGRSRPRTGPKKSTDAAGGSGFADRSLSQAAEPIADYAGTAGRRRKEHDTAHGTQPGDPAKAAAAAIQAVQSDQPPYMLLLGNDASDGFRAALDALRAEADAWEPLSRSTDFDA
jgi:hypothetical protein